MIFLGEIKEKYKQQHRKHEIHCVDNNERIVLREVNVDEFAVKLKINQESPTMDNFRDEARQHFANLHGMKGDDIEISQLIHDENRVTFIRGIAGMGKSVLAKQLAYGWANGDIFQNFEMCVMFECRDLNYFMSHEGAELKKHEVLSEFLKSMINYDLRNGQGVLLIVDGLDELYDVNEKYSIIFDLLNIKGKYSMAKVIITGRPHVEDMLAGFNNMGGLFKVEISGLNDDQVNKYIDQFSSREDHKVDITKARNSSENYLPIMTVPQFLNTFCCVAILGKGQAILNSSELYCWAVYLLLRQHADKGGGRDPSTISQIFRRFSHTLVSLSELCYNLLKENRVVFEGKIKSNLGKTEEEMKFIKSLFVDVGDCFKEKYQFKHLSLMEFLSALHICKSGRTTLRKIIKEHLEKGFIEVVSIVCQMLSGFSHEGIIKEMLINVVRSKQKVDGKELLVDILKVLNEGWLDDSTKLRTSFEIITLFLNKNRNEEEFIKSVIRTLHGVLLNSSTITTEHICEICKHLEDCGLKEEDIRMALTNVEFQGIDVSYVEQLDFVSVKNYFHIGGSIALLRMSTSVDAVRIKFKADNGNGYFGVVWLWECEFHDNFTEYGSTDRQLNRLSIVKCKWKTVNSFIKLCDWGLSCKEFWLQGLDIDIESWEILVATAEQKKEKEEMNMKRLFMHNCTTNMSREMAMRVR